MTRCWPWNTIGAPLIRPESLPNAITDPEKVIAPMNVPRKSSSLLPVGISAGSPSDTGSLTAAIAISTAARPTSECERGDELGHLRHLHAPGDHRTHDAADRDPGEDQPTFFVFE